MTVRRRFPCLHRPRPGSARALRRANEPWLGARMSMQATQALREGGFRARCSRRARRSSGCETLRQIQAPDAVDRDNRFISLQVRPRGVGDSYPPVRRCDRLDATVEHCGAVAGKPAQCVEFAGSGRPKFGRPSKARWSLVPMPLHGEIMGLAAPPQPPPIVQTSPSSSWSPRRSCWRWCRWHVASCIHFLRS